MLIIKNVILYDSYRHVVGFVELKNMNAGTQIRVKHNLVVDEEVSLSVNGHKYTMPVGKVFAADMHSVIDLEKEIFVRITFGDILLAAGAINEDEKPSKPLSEKPPLDKILADTDGLPIERNAKILGGKDTTVGSVALTAGPAKRPAVREIDEILRAVCQIDDQGKGICQECPYREFFYGEEVTYEA